MADSGFRPGQLSCLSSCWASLFPAKAVADPAAEAIEHTADRAGEDFQSVADSAVVDSVEVVAQAEDLADSAAAHSAAVVPEEVGKVVGNSSRFFNNPIPL